MNKECLDPINFDRIAGWCLYVLEFVLEFALKFVLNFLMLEIKH